MSAFLFVAFLLSCSLGIISLCSATNVEVVYYVTSSSSGNDCPPEAANSSTSGSSTRCETISFYTRNQDEYFHNNSVFYFLDGLHVLSESIIVEDAVNITLLGSNGGEGSTITCPSTNSTVNAGGIAFMNCEYVTVRYLTVSDCSMSIPLVSYYPASILFYESYSVMVDGVTVKGSLGRGLFARNVYGFTLKDSSFINNRDGAVIFYTIPETCFTSLQTFNLDVFDCNFTSSQGFSGLGIYMNNQLTYLVAINVDRVFAYNNSFVNVLFRFFDGFPRSANFSNIVSFDSKYGFVLYIYDHFDSTGSCINHYDSDVSHSAVIKVTNSILDYHTRYGMFAFFQFSTYFDESKLDVEVSNSSFTWNDEGGLFWDRNIDRNTILTAKIMDCSFMYNAKILNSGLFIYRTDSYFENIVVTNNFRSGLLLISSEATFSGKNNIFSNNNGYDGGAIGLFHSDIFISINTGITFINNTAQHKGGAIYMERVCGIQIVPPEATNRSLNNISLTFINNTALVGADMYGLSSPNHCSVNVGNLDDILHLYLPLSRKAFRSASDSVGVCICSDDEDQRQEDLNDCYEKTFSKNRYIPLNRTVYPGDYIEVQVGVVGFSGPPASYSLTDGVIDYIVDGVTVSSSPYIGMHCFTVREKIYQASNNDTVFEIQAKRTYLNILSRSTFPYIRVDVTMLPCPVGFSLTNGSCSCVSILRDQPADINCNITTGEVLVTRQDPVWYGLVDHSNDTCFITDTVCAYDYCNEGMVTFNILNDTGMQCNFNRVGLLCSQCPEGQSLTIGSNQCKECSNAWLASLILFIVAGVALVGIIIYLNITVSIGMINGLIFYANIIKVNEFIFFPSGAVPFVSQFISWLNLDFGIQLCFYNGMNTYSKAWLQFVFPWYIWSLILGIIVLCQLSSKASKVFGSHVISVLSTLFLLSYIKLLRSIIFVLSPQRLHMNCTDGQTYTELRWRADPTIHYLEPKHAVLFCFAIAMLILFVVPYTLGLLLSPLLQGYLSRYRICSFWHKLMPIFDAYNAPYKDRFRFWTGYLLVVRLPILAAVSVVNSFNTDKNSLLSITILLIVLSLTIANCVKGVYRIWYMNVLESLFLLNTVVIAVAATNDTYSSIYKGVAISSILLSFIAFVGIVIFHSYLKFSNKGDHSLTERKLHSFGELLMKPLNDETGKYKDTSRGSSAMLLINTGNADEWHTNDTDRSNSDRPSTSSSVVQLRRRETLILDDDDHSNDYVLITNPNK